MDSFRLQRVALAVLTLVAIALLGAAAAPIFDLDQGAENPPQSPGIGGTDGQGELDLPISPAIILTGVVAVGLVGLFAQFARDPWDSFVSVVEGVAAFALIIGFWAGLFQLFQTEGSAPEGEGAEPSARALTATPTAEATGYGEGSGNPFAIPVSETMFLALAVGVVTFVALLAWRSGAIRSALATRTDDTEDDPDESIATVGSVAGDAADEIQEAAAPEAADNAIYRAWREMVSLLDASDPQSDTPRGFARAATDAGMDADDVTVLTRTFEEVRYGDATLSEERRERATEVLRRMERSFGDTENDGEGIDEADAADADDEPEGAR